MRRRYRSPLIAAFLGTTALIVVMTTGDLAENQIGSNLAVLGNATLIKIILPVDTDFGDDPRHFNDSDLDAIRAIPGVAAVSPSVYSWWPRFLEFTGAYKNQDYPDLKICGVDPTFFKLASHLPITEGRAINEQDVKFMSTVCVIGDDVKKQLFGKNESPIGKPILIEGIEFIVIGRIEDPEDNNFDEAVIVPISVARSRLPAMYNIQRITVLPANLDVVEGVYNQIKAVLAFKRPLYKFSVQYEPELVNMIKNILSLFKLFTYVAVGATILLSGLGVANVMTTLVRERTMEIGLSKAVGAADEDIVGQFLLESIFVFLTGTIAGIIFGSIIVFILAWFVFIAPVPVNMYVRSVLAAIWLGTIIGVASGVLPARTASNMDPIEAMRYE